MADKEILMCNACNVHPADDGFKTCHTCRAKRAKYHYERCAEKRKNGICVFCMRKAIPGKCCCEFHRDKNARRRRERVEAFVSKGLCAGCGKNPIEQGKKYCKQCCDSIVENDRFKRKRCRINGICPRCKVRPSAEGHVNCQVCLDYQKEYDRKRRSKNNGLSDDE